MNPTQIETLKQYYDSTKEILRRQYLKARDNPRVFSQQEKDRIVVEVRAELAQRFESIPPHRSCLYASWTMIRRLFQEGAVPILQAGNMQWPRITREQDDGVSDSHWAYMYSPETVASQRSMMNGEMPEIHIWVGRLDHPQELIDINTCHFPNACKDMMRLDWPGPRPPDYLWQHPEEGLPDWVNYKAIVDACNLATWYMLDGIGNPYE